jgi:hypothetical protein
MSENLLSRMVLVKNNEFPTEEKKFEEVTEENKVEETPTDTSEEAGSEKVKETTEEKKFQDTEDKPVEVEPDGLPAQDIIKVLHEHNKWELDEESVNKYDNSEDGLMQFISDIVNANIPAPQYASEEVEEFNQYVNNGGDPQKFLETYYSNGNFNYEEADVEDEEVSKRIYRDYLKATTKFSDAKIDKEIQTKIDLDELSEEVKEAKEYMVEFDKEQKENLSKQLEQEKVAQQEHYRNFLTNQKKAIKDAKEIAGFEITDKLGEELFDFGFVRGKDGKTGYERLKDEDPQLDLKLLMLAYKGVDKATIAKEAESEASKKLKKNLSRYTDSTAKSTTNTAPADGEGKKGVNLQKWII